MLSLHSRSFLRMVRRDWEVYSLQFITLSIAFATAIIVISFCIHEFSIGNEYPENTVRVLRRNETKEFEGRNRLQYTGEIITLTTDLQTAEKELNSRNGDSSFTYRLQPLREIYFGPRVAGENEKHGEIYSVLILTCISGLILVLAIYQLHKSRIAHVARACEGDRHTKGCRSKPVTAARSSCERKRYRSLDFSHNRYRDPDRNENQSQRYGRGRTDHCPAGALHNRVSLDPSVGVRKGNARAASRHRCDHVPADEESDHGRSIGSKYFTHHLEPCHRTSDLEVADQRAGQEPRAGDLH